MAGKGRDVVISQRLLKPMAGEATMERLGTANHTHTQLLADLTILVQLGPNVHAPSNNRLMSSSSSSFVVSSWW